ncbi:conserved exported hypothetical protein [Tenacibaculum litopenaei]|uniref:hypothetical protein n=1 Tax=Tenacibaculum litopenaei TaxID=396016 RepID=UPI003894E222
MRTQLLLWMLLFLSLQSFAQLHFEKGHFITSKDKKIDAFILFENRKHTPSEFHYKLSLDAPTQLMEAKDLKAVQIGELARYEIHIVRIDNSTTKSSELSNTRLSVFKHKRLVLKVLIEGKATLMNYKRNSLERFFVRTGTEVVPLEFKKYVTSKGEVKYNRNYQKQLRDSYSCQDQTLNTAIGYRSKYLVPYFKNYNHCYDEPIKEYPKKGTKNSTAEGIAKIRIKAGLSNFVVGFDTPTSSPTSSTLNYHIGVELEYKFPFNNYKLSMFTEPTYHFNIKENVPYQIGTKQSYPNGPYVSVFENAVITYSGLEVPFGIKNHWFLDDVNFLNLHAGVSFNIPMNSTIKSSPKIKGEKIRSFTSTFIGLGYENNNKWSIDVRYYLHPRVLSNDLGPIIYNNLNLKVGYTLF